MNQNEKTKWIIAISDTCNDEINVRPEAGRGRVCPVRGQR